MASAGDTTASELPEGGLFLLKVPRWLSDAWLNAPPEAEVADLDLETGRLQCLAHSGDGRPSKFLVSRRASPELFAFSVCDENEEVPVEGSIDEALTVSVDLNDPSYRSMVEERRSGSASSSTKRSQLEEKLLPLGRSSFLASESIAHADAAQTGETMKIVWSAVQAALANHPDGIGCEELLPLLPRESPFIAVRAALCSMAEPIKVDGAKRFVTRRRTPAEVKAEMKTENQAALAAKLDMQAKLEMQAKREHQAKLERQAKEEGIAKPEHAKAEHVAKPEVVKQEVKREQPDEPAPSTISTESPAAGAEAPPAKRPRAQR